MEWIEHPRVIVASQDCDLEWDYGARQGTQKNDKLLSHILFCNVHLEEQIRARDTVKSDIFRRVRQNQDERYHCFNAAEIALHDSMLTFPALFIDFKGVFSLPTSYVYNRIDRGEASRKCIVPQPYLQDFTHRLFAFLGRVVLP